MSPLLASLICTCGIAGLFYLNRDSSIRTSKALWLPVIYLWIVGSRSVSNWLGVTSPTNYNEQLNGNPIDASVFALLGFAAIFVLIQRRHRVRPFLAANWPILIYFTYCLISVAWSSHPDVACKRWIKALDDLAMCLVILTDRQPRHALQRVISRVGFVLLPVSLLLIKYYGDLGRGYTADGEMMNTGVTTNKNMLGVMLFVVSLFTLWHVISLFRAKKEPGKGRRLWAQVALLIFGIVLLRAADSKTSIACLTFGAGLIFATGLRKIRSRPARVHLLCLGVFLLGGLTLFFGAGSFIVHAMGRQSNLSGRTQIWAALIPAAPNALLGAGFESFWISPNVIKFQETLNREGWYHAETLNESHDGYLEAYVNLGIVGVGLLAWILIDGYWRAVAAYRRDRLLGGLLIAYVIQAGFYNITEAGFRMLDLSWIFLLLAILTASGVAKGMIESEAPGIHVSRLKTARMQYAGSRPMPAEAGLPMTPVHPTLWE